MSRQPSPGAFHSAQSGAQVGKMQLKPKGFVGSGLTQSAEDAKYHSKYKELKRKVKEIEVDNDKLNYKVLLAKRNIQRMKLERAILYERLQAVPPSPDALDRPSLPPMNAVNQPYHHQPSMDADPGFIDYMRSHPASRVPLVAPDNGSEPYAPLRSARRDSMGGTHHDTRLGPTPLPSMQPPLDPDRGGHSRSHSHPSPVSQHSMPSQPKYTPSRPPPQMYDRHPAPYAETLPPVQHVLHSSPDRDRRRQDLHDLSIPSHPSHGPLSPPSDSRSSSSRTHNHQRLGPGTYANREDIRDRPPRDTDYDREWEMRERDRREQSRNRDLPSGGPMRSPPNPHRSSRHGMDYIDHRLRDEQSHYHEMTGVGPLPVPAPGYSMHSRSETPGSGSGASGSGGLVPGVEGTSRPDSREQYYEHERPRSFRLRPVSQQQQDDLDFVHEDGRSRDRDRGGSGGGVYTSSSELGGLNRSSSRIDTRKRRDDIIDIDDSLSAGGAAYTGQDRASKRFQRDRPRGAEDQDDERMAS